APATSSARALASSPTPSRIRRRGCSSPASAGTPSPSRSTTTPSSFPAFVERAQAHVEREAAAHADDIWWVLEPTMLVERDGGLVVAQHTDPEPGAGEVLVRVASAGLNGADMIQLKGGYPAPPGSPADIPGLELAGEVVATGPATFRFSEGDRVMGIVGGGA